jgi:hypothetical protein
MTDPERQVRGEGRPYGVIDGRLPEKLAIILTMSRNAVSHGWTVVDGAGNRPAVDKTVADVAHMVVLPFRASEEDVDTVGNDLRRLPQAFAWPSAWPVNAHAARSAEYLIVGLESAFPGRVIRPVIPFVNSVGDLLASNLVSPSTPTRSLAKKIFETLREKYQQLQQRDGSAVIERESASA